MIKYKKDLNDRTIFVSINGTLGNVATYNNEKVILGKSACYFNIKKDVDKSFIKYIVLNKEFQHYISEYATGTTIKNVPLKAIRDFKLKLPPLSTQTAIAEILSSLDDKIELNNAINKNLEDLAQALFKQWFVNFEFPNENGEPYRSSGGEMEESELGMIPKGWVVGKLGDILTVINGFAFKSGDFKEEGGNAVLKIRNIAGNIVDVTNTQFVTTDIVNNLQPKFEVNSSDILIAMTGAEVGKIGVVPKSEKKLWLNQRVGKLKPLLNGSIPFIYALFNVINLTQEVRNTAMGSAQPNISSTGIEGLKIVLPTFHLIELFSEIFSTNYHLMIDSLNENQQLISLRDTLLPKLISGELSVNQAEEMIEQADVTVDY